MPIAAPRVSPQRSEKLWGKQPTFCEKVKKGVSEIEECKLGQFHKDDIIQLVLKCHLLMHSSWHVCLMKTSKKHFAQSHSQAAH